MNIYFCIGIYLCIYPIKITQYIYQGSYRHFDKGIYMILMGVKILIFFLCAYICKIIVGHYIYRVIYVIMYFYRGVYANTNFHTGLM